MDTIIFRNFVVRIARQRPTTARKWWREGSGGIQEAPDGDRKESEGYERFPTRAGRNRRPTKRS